MGWDVLREPWVRVLKTNGSRECVSPINALLQADSIRLLEIQNPLDLFAAHRFLVALSYWGKSLDDEKFDLYGDNPFFQDTTLDGEMFVPSRLFIELPTQTNVNFFKHILDKNVHICLPCVAQGLIRLPIWTQIGGRGLTASLNGNPPTVVLALGSNLAETLKLNMPELSVPKGEPQWSGCFKPSSKISYMEAFTWNPRRVKIDHPHLGNCCRCGASPVDVISRIHFARNHQTAKVSIPTSEWLDPNIVYYPGKAGVLKVARSTPDVDGPGKNYVEEVKRILKQGATKVFKETGCYSLIIPTVKSSKDAGLLDMRIEKLNWDIPIEEPERYSRPTSQPAYSSFFEFAERDLSLAEWREIGRTRQIKDSSQKLFEHFMQLVRLVRKDRMSRPILWIVLRTMAKHPDKRTYKGGYCPRRNESESSILKAEKIDWAAYYNELVGKETA